LHNAIQRLCAQALRLIYWLAIGASVIEIAWIRSPISGNEMSTTLKGKRLLVTGAQQGITEAMAIAFAQAGADVAVNYLDDVKAAEKVVHTAQTHGVRAVALQADVSVVAEATGLVERAVEQLGGIDILINNAGVFPRVPMLDMREADWDFVLDVNLKGSFFCAQAAAKAMIAADKPGVIINIASQAIAGRSPRGVHYSASKGGIVSMTRAMPFELIPHNIRVNAIAPGTTDTAQPRYGATEDEIAERAKTIPIGRIAQPAEIAAVAAFLASDAASYMIGQTVHVNGGSLSP
jgi:3-oxoacyl-[acyl-carrier protein] reductase